MSKTRSSGPVESVVTPLDSEGWIGMDSQEVARQWGQLAHVPRPPIPDLDSGRWEWLQDPGVLPRSDFFLYKEQDDAPTQTMRLLYVTAAEAWGAPVNVAKAQSFCRYKKGTFVTLWPGDRGSFMDLQEHEGPLLDAAERWEAACFVKAAFDRHFPEEPEPAPAPKPRVVKPKPKKEIMVKLDGLLDWGWVKNSEAPEGWFWQKRKGRGGHTYTTFHGPQGHYCESIASMISGRWTPRKYITIPPTQWIPSNAAPAPVAEAKPVMDEEAIEEMFSKLGEAQKKAMVNKLIMQL